MPILRPHETLPSLPTGKVIHRPRSPRGDGLAVVGGAGLRTYLAHLDRLGLPDTLNIAAALTDAESLIAQAQRSRPVAVDHARNVAAAVETVNLDGLDLRFTSPDEANTRRRTALAAAARIVQAAADRIHAHGDQHVTMVTPMLDKAINAATIPKTTPGQVHDAALIWDAGRELLAWLRTLGAVPRAVGVPHGEAYYFTNLEAVHAWRIHHAGKVVGAWTTTAPGEAQEVAYRALNAPPVDLATAASHPEWGYQVRTAAEVATVQEHARQ